MAQRFDVPTPSFEQHHVTCTDSSLKQRVVLNDRIHLAYTLDFVYV